MQKEGKGREKGRKNAPWEVGSSLELELIKHRMYNHSVRGTERVCKH